MNINRVLGALLGGVARPPRRRGPAGLGGLIGGRSREAQIVRAVGAVAGVAIDSYMRNREAKAAAAAREAPPPAAPSRPAAPPAAGRPWAAPAPAAPAGRRMPDTGPVRMGVPEPAPGPSAEEAEALLLVRTMIAAAKADGQVDPAERAAIAAQLDAAGLDADERDFILRDFDRPLAPAELAAAATDPMLRARLYAAAVAGVGEVSPAERAWLDRLAAALRLDKAAAAAIEDRLKD